MKMISIRTFLIIFPYIFVSLSFAMPIQTSFLQISKLFTENGCSNESIVKQAVKLNASSKNKNDILVYCEADCGASQCSYSIYSFQNQSYVYRGSFTGNYKIAKSKSKSFYDLVITAGTAFGKTENKMLKFNGVEYQ